MRKVLIGLVLLCLATTACSPAALFKPRIALEELSFDVAPGANEDTVVALELVAVNDEYLLNHLGTLTAAQWFDPQANFRRDYPASLRIWRYELPPNSRLQLPQPLPFAHQPGRGLLLFANYRTPGAHRLRLDAYNKAIVVFGPSAISVQALP